MDALLWLLTSLLGAAIFFVVLSSRPGGRTSNSTENSKGARPVSELPAPPSLPILGNLLEVVRKGYHICHLQWMSQYGSMYRYRMGPVTVVVVADPAFVRDMAMQHFKVFHDRPIPPNAAATTDRGLLFAKGAYWAGLRASLTPAFLNDSSVAQLLPHVALSCLELLQKLQLLEGSLPVEESLQRLQLLEGSLPVAGDSETLKGSPEFQAGQLLEETPPVQVEQRLQCLQTESEALEGSKELLGLEKESGSGKSFCVDILPLLEESALDAIGMSCFGAEQWRKSLPSPAHESSMRPAAVYSILESLSSRVGLGPQLLLLLCPDALRPALRWCLSSIPGLTIRRTALLRKALFTQWEERLAATKAPLSEETNAEETITEETSGRHAGKQPNDLVQSLLKARVKGTNAPLTNSDIVAALFNLIGAGSGTTATTVACALYYLAANPQVQQRAREEVQSSVAQQRQGLGVPKGRTGAQSKQCLQEGEGATPGVEALAGLTYLDAVVKETLRLCPPGALLARAPSEDAVLGGYLIPKGTPVLAPIYAMHRCERFFPRPDDFLPGRFLSAQGVATQQGATPRGGVRSDSQGPGVDVSANGAKVVVPGEGALMPFGLGPRMCLGLKYAMLESKMFLAEVLCRYSVGPSCENQEMDLAAGLNLKPRNGMKLEFTRLCTP